MNFLSGKKTIVGGLLLSLSALVWWADQLTPGVEWFTREQYESFAVLIGGLTQVTMRIGIANGAANPPPPA